MVNVNYDWFARHPDDGLGEVRAHGRTVGGGRRRPTSASSRRSIRPTWPQMGRVVVSGVAVGGASLRLNRQNYYRDEVKAT